MYVIGIKAISSPVHRLTAAVAGREKNNGRQ